VNGKLQSIAPYTPEKDPEVTVTEPNWKAIPSEALGYRETYTNCTSLQQSITFKHTESSKIGSKVTKTASISNTEKIDAKIDFKFTDSFSSGLTASFSKTVTLTDTNEQNYEENKTLDFTIPLTIAPQTRVSMDHRWIRRETPIPFNGSVIIDSGIITNRENILRLSQALPSAADRIFNFAGFVTNSTLLEGETKVFETKLSSAECSSNPGFKMRPEVYREVIR
jgi:hypothetical protein